jgi:hypothetical protein
MHSSPHEEQRGHMSVSGEQRACLQGEESQFRFGLPKLGNLLDPARPQHLALCSSPPTVIKPTMSAAGRCYRPSQVPPCPGVTVLTDLRYNTW